MVVVRDHWKVGRLEREWELHKVVVKAERMEEWLDSPTGAELAAEWAVRWGTKQVGRSDEKRANPKEVKMAPRGVAGWAADSV